VSEVSSRREWRVIWGAVGKPGFVQVIVEAFDVDEALVIGYELRPELPRPRVAFLVGGDPNGIGEYPSPTLGLHE
jgi:hypothetical protein